MSNQTGAQAPAETLYQQVAALCHRVGKSGPEILLVTSSKGRWILPKGWPMKGKQDHQTALQEAWEEAGVKSGNANPAPLGQFDSVKTLHGDAADFTVRVHEIETLKTSRDFPEADRRIRRWVSPRKAAKMVTEPGLRKLLKNWSPRQAA